jgi:hypothetical protein
VRNLSLAEQERRDRQDHEQAELEQGREVLRPGGLPMAEQIGQRNRKDNDRGDDSKEKLPLLVGQSEGRQQVHRGDVARHRQRRGKAEEERRPAGEKGRHRAVGLAEVDVFAARAGQSRREFGDTQRPAHGQQAAQRPQPENQRIVPERGHHVPRRDQDSRPHHAGDHHVG